jgi:hypothetical protein
MHPPCLNPFQHLRDLAVTHDHDCGHQFDVLPCGCVVDDHQTEPCDGMLIAQLEESNA